MNKMNKIFQNVLTIFMGVSLILLSGCPKKITPINKSSKERPVTPPSGDGSQNGTSTTPPKEEVIPRISKLEESVETIIPRVDHLEDSVDTLKNKDQQAGKASPLKDIFFDLDQFAPRSADLSVIQQNAKWIIAHPNEKVQIEGHGDSRGTNEYNLVLGEKRANAIKNALVKMGVEVSRLATISYGEERPFCTREDEECYQENRRAHFHVE